MRDCVYLQRSSVRPRPALILAMILLEGAPIIMLTEANINEGSLAGGHLGFKKADLENQTCQSLEEILAATVLNQEHERLEWRYRPIHLKELESGK